MNCFRIRFLSVLLLTPVHLSQFSCHRVCVLCFVYFVFGAVCLSVISSTQNPVQLCYTIQHRTVLIIFLLIIQTIIIAQMLSNRGEVGQTFVKVCIVFCNVKLWRNIEFRLITEGRHSGALWLREYGLLHFLAGGRKRRNKPERVLFGLLGQFPSLSLLCRVMLPCFWLSVPVQLIA